MFHDGDLQSGIAAAVQQSKAVLCFVHDESDASQDWEKTLTEDNELRAKISQHAISLRLLAGSQEAGFLSSFTTLNDIPTVIVIRDGKVQLHAHAGQPGGGRLKDRMLLLLSAATTKTPLANTINAATPDAPSSPIPSAASNTSYVPPLPPSGLSNAHNAPAATSSSPIISAPIAPNLTRTTLSVVPENQPTAQQSQRNDYIKMQKEREQKARDERDRIKQQIKADREERRRLDQVRKQQDTTSEGGVQSSAVAKPRSTEIRVQVRTFDGSTLRQSFSPASTITKDIRPWVDELAQQSAPYNLKLILTPLPNRNIEAGEEDQPLPDLGVKGSCTLVMVPVQGYVESYKGGTTGGLVGSAVSGGYSLLSGTAGALFGGVRSVLGYGQSAEEVTSASSMNNADPDASSTPPTQVRVRSLADQRAEASKRDQQFYNGNSTNFQPRRGEEKED